MPGIKVVDDENNKAEQTLSTHKVEQLQQLKDDTPVVENVKDGDEEEDDDVDGEQEAGSNENSKQSRSEKKSRKAMLKLGMKPVTDASRVSA